MLKSERGGFIGKANKSNEIGQRMKRKIANKTLRDAEKKGNKKENMIIQD
jgi:hypothetical protein